MHSLLLFTGQLNAYIRVEVNEANGYRSHAIT
jgi:hypothetical protein